MSQTETSCDHGCGYCSECVRTRDSARVLVNDSGPYRSVQAEKPIGRRQTLHTVAITREELARLLGAPDDALSTADLATRTLNGVVTEVVVRWTEADS